MTRVRGLDAARGLALMGMVVAHLDTRIDFDPGVAASWRHVGDGRAAVLFVVVAGFSLALATGGATPHTGRRAADDRLAVFVRAAALAGIGALLTALGTPVAVILASYAVFFVLALPLLHRSPTVLLTVGTALVVLGPLLIGFLEREVPTLGMNPVGTLLVGFPYPALQWTGFLLVGLGLGRLRWRDWDLGVLTVIGIGAGALLHLLMSSVRADLSPAGPLDGVVVQAFVSQDRSENPIEALSALAISVGVLAGLILLAPRTGRLLYPVEAAGRMALTLYVAHVVAYWVAIRSDASLATGSGALAGWTLVVALVVASLWFLRFSRGPLEALLHRLVLTAQGTPTAAR